MRRTILLSVVLGGCHKLQPDELTGLANDIVWMHAAGFQAARKAANADPDLSTGASVEVVLDSTAYDDYFEGEIALGVTMLQRPEGQEWTIGVEYQDALPARTPINGGGTWTVLGTPGDPATAYSHDISVAIQLEGRNKPIEISLESEPSEDDTSIHEASGEIDGDPVDIEVEL